MMKYIHNINYDISDYKNKSVKLNYYITSMLNKTQSMFEYTNLPDTIPQDIFELYLQTNGSCIVTDINNNLYAFTGGFGGQPDVYYRPTIYTVANPALNLSKNYEIDVDCILVKNDPLVTGLIPMYKHYATQLVESDISLLIADINTRLINLVSAQDDRTKKSAELLLSQIIDGNFGVVSETAMLDSLKSTPYSSTNSNVITSLIEQHQYIKASWYNDIGLNVNHNMKREYLNSTETQLNSETTKPLIDIMLQCRQEALDKINKKYNTNIQVKLNSSWNESEVLDDESESVTETEPSSN